VDKDHVGAEWMQIVLCLSTKAFSYDNEHFSLEYEIVLTGIQCQPYKGNFSHLLQESEKSGLCRKCVL